MTQATGSRLTDGATQAPLTDLFFNFVIHEIDALIYGDSCLSTGPLGRGELCDRDQGVFIRSSDGHPLTVSSPSVQL